MRLVHEARQAEPELSVNAAVNRVRQRVAVNPDTLRGWCKQADIDAGRRRGDDDAVKIKQLESEAPPLLDRDRAGVLP